MLTRVQEHTKSLHYQDYFIKTYIYLKFRYTIAVTVSLTTTMIIVIPQSLKEKSRVQDLKERLDWGEPALTIIDVRSRDVFNISHIMGAISMPLNELVNRALMSLELVRDIYVYGSDDQETSQAAALLKDAGYENVAELGGGLAAWKAVGYPIDGNDNVIA
jgi:rhodanese-related sulfurtransferase